MRKVFEEIAVDDVIVQDPNIANQIVQTQKQINDRLKRIAQINNEIATYKQQVGALKDRAIQQQKAQMSANQKAAESKPAAEGDASGDNSQNESLFMPSLEEFISEEAQYVPYMEDKAGNVYMDGKPRFQKYKKRVEAELTDDDQDYINEIQKKVWALTLVLEEYKEKLAELKNSKEDADMYFDQLAGSVGAEMMEILSSGIHRKDKILLSARLGYTGTEVKELQQEFDDMIQRLERMPDSIRKILGKISQTESKISELENFMDSIGVSYEDDYMPVKIQESSDEKFDEDEDIFYVQIPPQTEIDGEVVAKVFREDEGEKWYVRDIEDEAEFLDELVFQKNYTKPEIIGYLASIFGDVIEIDHDEFEDLIDDKAELDAKYFPDNKNKRMRLTK